MVPIRSGSLPRPRIPRRNQGPLYDSPQLVEDAFVAPKMEEGCYAVSCQDAPFKHDRTPSQCSISERRLLLVVTEVCDTGHFFLVYVVHVEIYRGFGSADTNTSIGQFL